MQQEANPALEPNQFSSSNRNWIDLDWFELQKGPWQPWTKSFRDASWWFSVMLWVIIAHHDESSWFIMMTHHDASSRYIIMMHQSCLFIIKHHPDSLWLIIMVHVRMNHHASWYRIMMTHLMTHDELSWWILMIHHDEPWRSIMMNHRVALKGLRSELWWPFLSWAPSIDAAHLFMVPMVFVQAEAL